MYVVALVPALVMAVVQPVWSRVDEAQHADYIAHLAQGQWPVEGRTRITALTFDVMRETGTYRWHLPGEEPVPPEQSVADFTPPPAVSGVARKEWTARHLWTYSYEAAQPPLFYLLAVPFWVAGKSAGGALGAVYAVRLFDALLVAALAPLAALASLLVSPSGRRAVATAALAALVPGMLLNGTAVTNEALAAVLGGLLTVLALLGVRRGWTLRLAALTGVVLGLAMLAKLTAAGLVIGLGVAFLWPRVAGRASLGECLRPAATAAALALAVLTPWLALNLAVYGHPVPTREVDQLLGSFFGENVITPRLVATSFKNGYATFWSGEPWDSLPIVRPLTALALLWCLAAMVGIQRMLRAPGSRAMTAVVTAISVGTAVWAFVAMLLSHIGGYMPGRYVYPALVAIAVVLVHGGAAAFGPGRLRALAVAGFAGYVAIAGADIAGYAGGLSSVERHPSLVPPAAGREQAVAATGSMGPVTVTFDRVVRDAAQRRIYAHLRVVNGGDSTMEWWPVAVLAYPGQPVINSDYPEGDRLPEQMPAGTVKEGWVVFDQVPAAALSGSLQLGFLGVASGGYRVYGDVMTAIPRG